MGTMIQAKCECGFSSDEIFQGSGMIETRKDMEPAYCEKCHRLVVLNYLDLKPHCPHCRSEVRFYNNPSLQRTPNKKKTDNEFIRWGNFLLPDAEYLCPQCGKMTMRFLVIGNWD